MQMTRFRHGRRAVAAAAVLTVLLLGWIGSGSPIWCTITVTTSEGLRDAMDTLPPGSTICLQPGTYAAGFVIRKDLTLRGTRSAQVILTASGLDDTAVLEIAPDYREVIHVTLRDLTLTGASGGETGTYREDHGLLLAEGSIVFLQNVVCSGNSGSAFIWTGTHSCSPIAVTSTGMEPEDSWRAHRPLALRTAGSSRTDWALA